MSFHATRPLLKIAPSKREWLARQFHDPYVRARWAGPVKFRSRSAFKLLELDEKWKFLSPDVMTVVDLGAAPGGWSQVAAGKLGWIEEDVFELPRKPQREAVRDNSGFGLLTRDTSWSAAEAGGQDERGMEDELDPLADLETDPRDALRASLRKGRGTIIAVDLLPVLSIPGVQTVKMDFLAPHAQRTIRTLLEKEPGADGKADVILSDMAANSSGNKTHDIESALEICQAAFSFAKRNLRTADDLGRRKGGVLIMKYFEHPLMAKFRQLYLKPYFRAVFNAKPDASRSESSETYWVCMGFTGQRKSFPRNFKPEVIRTTDESEVPDDLELPPETLVRVNRDGS